MNDIGDSFYFMVDDIVYVCFNHRPLKTSLHTKTIIAEKKILIGADENVEASLP